MSLSQWGASEWGAFGQVGAFVVATVAGGVVIEQVRQAKSSWRDQTRPYVIVDFEFRGMFVAINVRNIGSNPARDVEITFDPPLVADFRTGDTEALATFDSKIPMLAPGRSISIPFGHGPDIFGGDAGTPLRYEATATYRPLEGKTAYKDPPCVLDLAPYRHTLMERDDLHDIANRLKRIESSMKSWTAGGRLKVNVVAQADVARQHEALRARRQEATEPTEP